MKFFGGSQFAGLRDAEPSGGTQSLSLGMVEELKAELERFALDPGIRAGGSRAPARRPFARRHVRALYDSFHGAERLHNEFFGGNTRSITSCIDTRSPTSRS